METATELQYHLSARLAEHEQYIAHWQRSRAVGRPEQAPAMRRQRVRGPAPAAWFRWLTPFLRPHTA